MIYIRGKESGIIPWKYQVKVVNHWKSTMIKKSLFPLIKNIEKIQMIESLLQLPYPNEAITFEPQQQILVACTLHYNPDYVLVGPLTHPCPPFCKMSFDWFPQLKKLISFCSPFLKSKKKNSVLRFYI